MNDQKHLTRHVWQWPLTIGALSAIGLVSALLGDGWADVLAWIGLGAPVLVATFFTAHKQ
jgi:hypothetical protein